MLIEKFSCCRRNLLQHIMATGETNNCTESFFQVVSKGAVPELQELLEKIEPQERATIADAFNSERETPLLLAIKGNHFKMMKFLIEELKVDIYKPGRFNWKGVAYTEAPPLFAAILSDFTSNHCIVNFIVLKTTANLTFLLPSVMFVTIPQSQKIDMLELMGAVNLLQTTNEEERWGFEWFGPICWQLALNLHQPENLPILKTTLSASAQKIFGQTTEFRTYEDLEEICNSPERLSHLQTQAILVTQRIMSRLDPDPHPFYLRSLIRYSVVRFTNANQYSSRVDVVNLILELFHSRQWKDVIDFDWCDTLVWDALKTIAYSYWMETREPNTLQLPFDSFMDVINFVTDLVFLLQQHPDPLQKKKANKFVLCISNSIMMYTEHDKETSPEFKKWLSRYIQFTNSHPGVYTVLHAICFHCSPLSIKIAQLFLRGKADPNVKDENGNTPLHYLAMFCDNFPNVSAAIKLLLGEGAHLDEGNDKGVTPLDLFKAKEKRKLVPDPHLQELTRTVLPLSCLCAQIIRRNEIPCQEDLPSHLIPFIQRHSAK